MTARDKATVWLLDYASHWLTRAGDVVSAPLYRASGWAYRAWRRRAR